MLDWHYGWIKKEFSGIKNSLLWKALIILNKQFVIEWHWVKGHAGNKYNEEVDAIARRQVSKNERKKK